MLTINNFRDHMISIAKDKGLYEGFGQREIRQLENKYKPNPYGSLKERSIAAEIQELDNWIMCLDLSQIN